MIEDGLLIFIEPPEAYTATVVQSQLREALRMAKKIWESE
jgi:hypothetical protein